MMENERLRKQIAFILEADKEKCIVRQTHLSGNGRKENDAEREEQAAKRIFGLLPENHLHSQGGNLVCNIVK